MTPNLPRTSFQADDVAAAAARLTGTPGHLAKRLRAMLEEGAPRAAPRESSDARREREADTVAYERTVAAHRHRLATDFAQARGWEIAPSPLAVRELARRSPPGNWHRPPREWLSTMFNPTFFRDARRRAAAMVAHPLADVVEKGRLEIETWAAERDLVATFPDAPSWQDPRGAVLVVFEPVEVDEVAPAPRATPKPKVAAMTPTAAQAEPAQAAGFDIGSPPVPPMSQFSASSEVSVPEPAPDRAETGTEPALPAGPDLPSMRPVAPLDLDGITPRDLASEEDPDFDVVDPAELLIDEQYQRDLSPKSLALIRRIVENWSWSKFKVPTCVRVDGRLHVLDGQHSVIAAATHPGIQAVPVLIAKVPAVTDRAAAFVSHAKDRLQATALQIHRAALVAGDADAVTLDTVCRRAGVELLPFAPSDGRYTPRQSVAVVGLQRLIAKRGAERAGEVLGALAAADLAPISGDHVRLGEVLLCDPAYADSFDPERLTAAMRGLSAKTHAEARELAIAQRLSAWRALAAVLARNSRAGASRRRASA